MTSPLDWLHVDGRAWHHRGVRVERSFAFVDVSGFTALTELEGDERAVDVLTAFRALLRDHLRPAGRSHRQVAGRRRDAGVRDDSARCSRRSSSCTTWWVKSADGVEAVSIRSGITSGAVILMEGDDYVGHCVNVASRLCDLATAGEALAAPDVIADLPSWGRVVRQIQVDLRGVENPVPASSIEMARGLGPVSHDPICGLPLTTDTADGGRPRCQRRGRVVLFPGLSGHVEPASAARRLALSGRPFSLRTRPIVRSTPAAAVSMD